MAAAFRQLALALPVPPWKLSCPADVDQSRKLFPFLFFFSFIIACPMYYFLVKILLLLEETRALKRFLSFTVAVNQFYQEEWLAGHGKAIPRQGLDNLFVFCTNMSLNKKLVLMALELYSCINVSVRLGKQRFGNCRWRGSSQHRRSLRCSSGAGHRRALRTAGSSFPPRERAARSGASPNYSRLGTISSGCISALHTARNIGFE